MSDGTQDETREFEFLFPLLGVCKDCNDYDKSKHRLADWKEWKPLSNIRVRPTPKDDNGETLET